MMQLLTTRNSNTQNPLQDLRYTYDPVGNIVEIYDASKETSYYKNSEIEPRHLFTYDALYRLLSGTGRELLGLAQATSGGYAANSAGAADAKALHTYTQNFAYDELGNIKSIQHTTLTSTLNWTRNYVYDEATNRLLKHDDNQTLPDYTYDEHGNITKMPHLQSMHYDYKDQLNKVVLDASENTAYYIYDANGQRVRKVIEKTGGIKEERYYLGNYEVYRKFVGITLETERTTVAVADDKRKIATIDKLTVKERSLINMPVAVIRYQHDNHLGSASLELDATAQIISYEEYHPFGSTSYRSGRSETEVSLKRYKYVGKERDEETGLYYYGFRYYAPWIARFINVDPLQHEYPHYTPFQYAGNKPVTYVDLDGLEEDKKEEETQRMPQLKAKTIGFEDVEILERTYDSNKVSNIGSVHFVDKDTELKVREAMYGDAYFKNHIKELSKSEVTYTYQWNGDFDGNNMTQAEIENYLNTESKDNFQPDPVTGNPIVNFVTYKSGTERGYFTGLYHETMHAIQFENGRLGFFNDGEKWVNFTQFYDIIDEIEACEAGMKAPGYWDHPKQNFMKKSLEQKAKFLKGKADSYNIIYKQNGLKALPYQQNNQGEKELIKTEKHFFFIIK